MTFHTWFTLALQASLIFSLIVQTSPTYGDYVYPPWAAAIGWFLACISSLPIPIGALHEMYISEGTGLKVSSLVVGETVVIV